MRDDELREVPFVEQIKHVVDKTDVPPVFIHPEIDLLYNCDFTLAATKQLRQLLELPRETLLKDLETVINDSIARYDYFSNLDWNNKTHNFNFHALFILRELEAEESLENIFDYLRQGEEFLDYWLSDSLTEDMWSVLLKCGYKQIDKLRDFILEPGIHLFARSEVSKAISQMYLHRIISRDIAEAWYANVFNYFIENFNKENLIDITLCGLMIGDCMDIKAKSVLPQIEQLYKQDIVALGVCGDWNDVLKKIESNKYDEDFYKYKIETLETTYENYEMIFSKNSGHIKYDDDFDDDDDDVFYTPPPQPIKAPVKIGRNEPCPCGSGKKYKKCHGN